MATITLKITGDNDIRALQHKLAYELNPARLTARAIAVAHEAGVLLLQATTRAVVEAVYDNPSLTPSDPSSTFGGNAADRSDDLLHSHILRQEEGGLVQVVEVDPNMPVSTDSHSGREMVIDYALAVHDGYVQWVMGHDTGVFHPGRFWMRVAELEAVPVILEFINKAFFDTIYEVFAA